MIISCSILFRMNKKGPVYVKCNNEVRPCNHCCSGKAISIVHCESVFVALGTQREMCMGYFVICCLSGSTTFFHLVNCMIFEEKSYGYKGF